LVGLLARRRHLRVTLRLHRPDTLHLPLRRRDQILTTPPGTLLLQHRLQSPDVPAGGRLHQTIDLLRRHRRRRLLEHPEPLGTIPVPAVLLKHLVDHARVDLLRLAAVERVHEDDLALPGDPQRPVTEPGEDASGRALRLSGDRVAQRVTRLQRQAKLRPSRHVDDRGVRLGDKLHRCGRC
jgi:hypothetical protein